MLLTFAAFLIHLKFSFLYYIMPNTPMPHINRETPTHISQPIGAIARLYCTVSNVDQTGVLINHLMKEQYFWIFSDLFHPLVWLPHDTHRPENVHQRFQLQCAPLHKKQSMGSHDPRSAATSGPPTWWSYKIQQRSMWVSNTASSWLFHGVSLRSENLEHISPHVCPKFSFYILHIDDTLIRNFLCLHFR